MDISLIAIIGFILLLALSVALRTKTGNKFEVKNPDVVLALVPVALWLFLSGHIQEFAFGDFKIVAAIKEASHSPVAPQLTELPVQSVEMSPKGGVEDIAEIKKRKSQALSFQLGRGGYWGPAIREYLEALTQDPFLRYIVINNADGSFFGMVDARQLAATLREPSHSLSPETFAEWLNSSNKAQLETLPDFLSAQQALKKTADKQRALQLMDSLDRQTLPVINDDSKFVGTVDRSKLTASILIDITQRLGAGQ